MIYLAQFKLAGPSSAAEMDIGTIAVPREVELWQNLFLLFVCTRGKT